MFSLLDMLGNAAPFIHIVDGGALWEGEQSVVYGSLLKSGRARVFGFEPIKEECEKLNRLGRRDETYLPYAIGDGTERRFVINSGPKTSSLYEANHRLINRLAALPELMRPVRREKISTTRLDDIPEIEAIDMLKLDIQGAELDALRGARRHLARTVVVHAEVEFVPLYDGQPLFAEIDQELRRHGFLLHMFPSTNGGVFLPFPNDGVPGQILWADAVFVRDFSRLDALDAQQLMRMAVILHEVYGSCDLAALCIQHCDAKSDTRLWDIYMRRLLGAKPPKPPPLE